MRREECGDARVFEIRPKKTWRLVVNLLVVGLWCAYLSVARDGYKHRIATHRSSGEAVLIFTCVTAGLFGILFVTLKTLFYVETIRVTSSTLSITGELFGFQLSNKSYENPTVRYLRYEEWSTGRGGMQNAIRFEYNDQTIPFARQANATKSWELIDTMCDVYKFSVLKPETPPGVASW